MFDENRAHFRQKWYQLSQEIVKIRSKANNIAANRCLFAAIMNMNAEKRCHFGESWYHSAPIPYGIFAEWYMFATNINTFAGFTYRFVRR